MSVEGPDRADVAAVERQLGRRPRDMVGVAHRCACGSPDVVRTAPRLADGTPFPTTFYATCPRLTGAVSTLESSGLMRRLSDRLSADEQLAARYAAAHRDYLRRREEIGEVAEIAQVSAGGMPMRVKCLHALVAHSLAAGPGVNPLGDEALALLAPWWGGGPCVSMDQAAPDQAEPDSAAYQAPDQASPPSRPEEPRTSQHQQGGRG